MRETKFRVWDVKAKKMRYPNEHDGMIWLTANKCIVALPGGELRISDEGDAYLWEPEILGYEFKKMDSTGLKDKNGKEVYNGDIIESKSSFIRLSTGKPTGRVCIETYQIIYLEDEARYATKAINAQYPKDYINKFAINQKQMSEYHEIISSIYENPELLKGDKNGM